MSHRDTQQGRIHAQVSTRMLSSKHLNTRLERAVRTASKQSHRTSLLTEFPTVTPRQPCQRQGTFPHKMCFPHRHTHQAQPCGAQRGRQTTHHLPTLPLPLPAGWLQDSLKPSRWQLRSTCAPERVGARMGGAAPRGPPPPPPQSCLSPPLATLPEPPSWSHPTR